MAQPRQFGVSGVLLIARAIEVARIDLQHLLVKQGADLQEAAVLFFNHRGRTRLMVAGAVSLCEATAIELGTGP